jgi:hypothetical protein
MSGTRLPILWVGAVCAALALAGGVIAMLMLARKRTAQEDPDGSRFMLQVAAGMSPIFLLVILMMSAPVFVLDACPK